MCSRVISYWFDVWSYKQLHFYLKLNKINDTMHVKFMMISYNEDVFKSDYLLILISGHIRNCNCYRNCYVTNHTMFNNFCWSTHKRHSIARPKGRGMGVSFVSSKGNIFCRLSNIELYKIFAIINRAIKGLHCIIRVQSYLDATLLVRQQPAHLTFGAHFTNMV